MESQHSELKHFIRRLSENEIPAALELAWRIFTEFETPDYEPEGTREFQKCLHVDAYLTGIEYYGAFDGEKLIGIIGIRADKNHICFFFVDGSYHRQGVGRRMFRYLLNDYGGKTINGIRFTPMEYRTGKP